MQVFKYEDCRYGSGGTITLNLDDYRNLSVLTRQGIPIWLSTTDKERALEIQKIFENEKIFNFRATSRGSWNDSHPEQRELNEKVQQIMNKHGLSKHDIHLYKLHKQINIICSYADSKGEYLAQVQEAKDKSFHKKIKIGACAAFIFFCTSAGVAELSSMTERSSLTKANPS